MKMATGFRRSGFTLIEIIIVLSIVGLLLSLAAPRYFKSIDRSKETVLRANLASTRDAIDKFYADTGAYPADLTTLVERRYLNKLPMDPIVNADDKWVVVSPPEGQPGTVFNITSSAEGVGSNGVPYAEW